ncbi:nuclear pore complex protein Nup88 [Corchorus capsularis]|uniref:Nuclear pore complex protein Nup88 n=1 Tax=Corchorus capsularis TaxID=210143 RepID=A0A1R3IQ64_COCAP|nr:nuclear pore complex protein Nup88 [Corchorus capsularis]
MVIPGSPRVHGPHRSRQVLSQFPAIQDLTRGVRGPNTPQLHTHGWSHQDAGNALEDARVELARYKAETSRMARWLRAKNLEIKWKQKQMERIKRRNKLTIGLINYANELVDEFLVAAECENANIRNEEAIQEAVQGVNDLNLHGSNNFRAVDNGSAAVDGGGQGGERHE